jgi:hypothetical protein
MVLAGLALLREAPRAPAFLGRLTVMSGLCAWHDRRSLSLSGLASSAARRFRHPGHASGLWYVSSDFQEGKSLRREHE